MSRSLWIPGSIACLFLIGAGFLFADEWLDSMEEASPSASEHVETAPAGMPVEEKIVRTDWPTPYPFFANNAPHESDYLQATVSGRYQSGGYGMVRSGGAQFHEGLDIRPIGRDRRGEATDTITPAMPGRVAYINNRTNGAYGRYVVVEHRLDGAKPYTLYAHLASIPSTLRVGEPVELGTPLGVMGRSDGSGGFPKDRAHLHFEIGLRLSNRFDHWYSGRKYPTKNPHGNYNGFNLTGLDPADFYRFVRDQNRAPKESALVDWIRERPVTVLVETPAHGVPDLLRNSPGLLRGDIAPESAQGWRIGFTAEGVPVHWEALRTRPTGTRVVQVDNERAREATRRKLIAAVRNKPNLYQTGSALEQMLDILLGR